MRSTLSHFRIAGTIIAIILILAISGACTSPIIQSQSNLPSEQNAQINNTNHPSEIENNNKPPIAYSPNDVDHRFLIIEEIVIALLFIALLVGIVANRLRVPYTVGLVLMGVILTLGVRINIQVSPNLILALLVPPLIFEAAFHLNIQDLKNNLTHILALAVPGVILTTFIVGGIVSWGTGLALPIALIFGAIVSATDPVSVIALFRTTGVPKRLQVLLEGESLLNDGTAIVIFNLVLVLVIRGINTFNPIASITQFIFVSGGGLVVGLLLGSLVSEMIRRIDDYLVETTLTTVLAFGSYLIAEILGVSGVLAVVAAGLINGNIGPKGMSPTTRLVVYNFWEYVGFLANTFIFLLIGLQINLSSLYENMYLILWGIVAVLVARAVGIYPLARIGKNIPIKWHHVLYWGGLRGAISLALALSLPATLGQVRDQIQIMAFGLVLFTLLVQGFTMAPLVKHLGIIERSEARDEYERRHARAVAGRSAYEHLQRLHRQGLISDHSWILLKPMLSEHNKSLIDAVREVLSKSPDLEAEELSSAQREFLRAQRSTINTLLKNGIISDKSYEYLIAEIDAGLIESQANWPAFYGQAVNRYNAINRLSIAVVHEQDMENAISALTKIGFVVTCLPSIGGFLRRRNISLLIGYEKGQEEAVVVALNKSCRKRIDYLVNPTTLTNHVPLIPTPITVAGATIFSFEVERFEIF